MLHLDDIEVRELRPGFFGKFIHGDKGTVTVWDIKKGSRLETHSHVHEQITYVTAGQLQMNIGGEEYTFTAGMTHVIPSGVPHSAIAKTDVKVIDFFSPARDDYK
jgi:quercetin dioxygenase-like cupin family protein